MFFFSHFQALWYRYGAGGNIGFSKEAWWKQRQGCWGYEDRQDYNKSSWKWSMLGKLRKWGNGVKNTKNMASKDLKSQWKKNNTGIGNTEEKHWNKKKWLLANGMVEIKIVDIDSFNQYPTIYIYVFLNIKTKSKKLHLYLMIYFWNTLLKKFF